MAYLTPLSLCLKCPLAQSQCACEKGERGPIGPPVSIPPTNIDPWSPKVFQITYHNITFQCSGIQLLQILAN